MNTVLTEPGHTVYISHILLLQTNKQKNEEFLHNSITGRAGGIKFEMSGQIPYSMQFSKKHS
jgi:hypothetical protein